jgi:uncharacterized protein with HEPN domain
MPRDEITLLDIGRAARLIVDFVGGSTREGFLQDAKTQSAVLHQLLIIGEAVKRLSKESRAAYPAVPWSPMAGMRDKLIHAYDEVDLEQVWETVARDIPELLRELEPLLPQGDDS